MSTDDITDIHICGACRTEFHNVDLFLLHKRLSCPAVLQSAVTSTVPSQKDGTTVARSNNLSQSQISVSKGSHSMVTTSLGSNMGIQVQSPGLTVVQDATMETPHPGERGGVASSFMITPPQGHEYIQTNQRPAIIQTTNQNKPESQIILTMKGELLVLQPNPPDGTEQNEAEIGQQNQAMLNFIQYLRTNCGSTTNGPVLPSLLANTEGIACPTSAPIEELGQNGSISVMSTPVSQPLTVCPSDLHHENLLEQSNQRSLMENPPQVTFDTASQLEGSDPSNSVIPAQDLAQQAARLSGVVESDLQTVSMETDAQQSDLDTVQYSVNVVNITQSTNPEGVRQVIQIPESNVKDENVVFSDSIGQLLQESKKLKKFSGKTVIARGAKAHCSSKNSSRSSSLSKLSGSPSKSPGTPRKVRTPPVKKFKCHHDDKCTFSSAYLKDLERHFRTHTGEKPFSCKYCDRSFSRVDKLHLHMRAHTGDKPYKCKFCNYSAVDNSSLRKHAIVHTDERPHKCQVCPYACRTASQLTVHLRTHTGDSPFPCPFCPAKFKIKSDLRRHLRVHTGEKPYQCDKCDARCATKGNLASHNRVHHSSENQMKCTVCDFSTSSKRSYKEHIKSHEPDDPDCVCHVCQYKCSNREVLRSHLSRHEKEKNYNCMHCYFSTNYKAKLTLHIKRRHMQIEPKVTNTKGRQAKSSEVKVSGSLGKFSKAFTCHLCPESFVRKDSLRSHIRLHEEMANSTLTTALTVLKLQQPVINVSTSGSGQYKVAPVNVDGILDTRDGNSVRLSKGQEQVVTQYEGDHTTIASVVSADNDIEIEKGRYGNRTSKKHSQSREGHCEGANELIHGQDRLQREELHQQGMEMINLQTDAPELSQIVSPSYNNTSSPRVQTSMDSSVVTLDMRTLSSDDITIVEPQGIAEARKMLLHRQGHNHQLRTTQEKSDDLPSQNLYRQLGASEIPCDVQVRNVSESTDLYCSSSDVTKKQLLERKNCDSNNDRYQSEIYSTSSPEQNSSGGGNPLETTTDDTRHVIQTVTECPEVSMSDHVQFQPQMVPSIQFVQNISFPVIRHPSSLIIPSVNGQTIVGGTIQQGDITTLPQGEVTAMQQGNLTSIQQGDGTSLQQDLSSFQGIATVQGDITSISNVQPRGIITQQQDDITSEQGRDINTLQQREATNTLSLNAQLQDGDTHLTLPIQILPQQNQNFQMIGVSQLLNTTSNGVQILLPRSLDNYNAADENVVASSITPLENPAISCTLNPMDESSSIRIGQQSFVRSNKLSKVTTGQVKVASDQTVTGSSGESVDSLIGHQVNGQKGVVIPMSPVIQQKVQTGGLISTTPLLPQIQQTGNLVSTLPVVSQKQPTRNLVSSLPMVSQAQQKGNFVTSLPVVSQTQQTEHLASPVTDGQDLVSIPVSLIQVPQIETSQSLPDQHTKMGSC
ncbi:uncharacterized protein LOC132553934 [Ylistrum balloti]|uniref:uncharacterized protein LOC132553934 n=1 Tax=Ylistrum balloti TaxID=509963 RepID=UPI002905B5E7|nr:uncharacterized protein LOC132553934 [Ylistrum balloti]